MSYGNWAEYWWDVVTGPSSLVDRVVEELGQDRSIILHVPRDLPWRHEMRDVIRARLQGELAATSLVVDEVDVADDSAQDPSAWAEVGRGLLNRFALRDVRLNFRGGDVTEYLMSAGVLANRVVWVKGLNAKTLPAWKSFCRSWHPHGLTDGLFVLEVPTMAEAANVPEESGGSVVIVDYHEYINDYSAQLFCGTMLDATDASGLSTERKRYLAAVLTHICHGDVETAALLVDCYRTGEMSLHNALATVAEELPLRGNVSSTGSSTISGSIQCIDATTSSTPEHPLAAARRGDWHSIEISVWQAQLEVLFPLIESERLRIVDSLAPDLWSLINQGNITQYNTKVDSPRDVELGTLVYLMAKREGGGQRALYVPDGAIRNRIHLLHDCRNNLAHGDCCSRAQVDQLLEDKHKAL